MDTTGMIGKLVVFGYKGERRQVKVETVNLAPKKGSPCFGGYDYTLEDGEEKGYRSFHIDLADNVKVIG